METCNLCFSVVFSPEAGLWAAKRDLLSDLAPWAINFLWSFRDQFPLVCVECVGQCWTPWWIQGLQWCWLHMETALPRGIMRNALVPQLVLGSWHNCSSSNAALKALITRWANSWYYCLILFQDIFADFFESQQKKIFPSYLTIKLLYCNLSENVWATQYQRHPSGIPEWLVLSVEWEGCSNIPFMIIRLKFQENQRWQPPEMFGSHIWDKCLWASCDLWLLFLVGQTATP